MFACVCERNRDAERFNVPLTAPYAVRGNPFEKDVDVSVDNVVMVTNKSVHGQHWEV